MIVAGAVAAAVFIGLVRGVARRRRDAELVVYAAGLVVAAAVYVLFALDAGGSGRVLGWHGLGVVLFGGAALAGRRADRWWLALGWLLHALWDLYGDRGVAPAWYPAACLGFDLSLGGYIGLLLLRSPRSVG